MSEGRKQTSVSFDSRVLVSLLLWMCFLYLIGNAFISPLESPWPITGFQALLALGLALWLESVVFGYSPLGKYLEVLDLWFDANSQRAVLVLFGLWIAFAATLGYLCIAGYLGVRLLNGADLSIFAQSLWNNIHGGFFENTLEAWMARREILSHFGVHNQPFLLLFFPFYWISQSPLTLQLLQVIIVPLGGVSVFLLARRCSGSDIAALCLCVAYWMQPAFWKNVLDFHPVDFVLLLLPTTVLLFEMGRWTTGWLCLGLMVACKENMALVGMFTGLFVAWRYKAVRSGIIASALCLLWFVASVYWIIPHFAHSPHLALHRYSQFGINVHSIIAHILTHPIATAHYALGKGKLDYVFQLAFQYAMVPLLEPAALVILIPELMQNLLSNFVADLDPAGRTAVSLAAVLIVASAMATRKIRDAYQGRSQLRWLCLAIAFLALTVAGGPQFRKVVSWVRSPDRTLVRELEQARQLIGRNESLSVHKEVAYFFCNREKIYFFPIKSLNTRKVLLIKTKPVWPMPEAFPKYVKRLGESKNHKVLFHGRRVVLWEKR